MHRAMLGASQSAGAIVAAFCLCLGVPVLSRRENRLQPRRNTMIVATIVYDNGRTRLDCVIRNLSDGGAKLEFATVRGIPQSFDLMVPGHHPQHCRVAWRALKELGVQFMSAA
jgi:hypothetical protein